MDESAWQTTWDAATKLATVLGILAFVLQVVTLLYVWRIQRKVFIVARVPELIES